MKCCICDDEIEAFGSWEYGNNADPVKNGRCCDHCNGTKVIPARLSIIVFNKMNCTKCKKKKNMIRRKDGVGICKYCKNTRWEYEKREK